jgi:anti-sigma factor RsiW
MRALVTDADLHALVDGELSGRTRKDVMRHVAGDSAAALQVQRWIAARDALRATLAPVAEEPLPLRLTMSRIEPALTRDRDARRHLLFALGFVAGFVIGLGVAASLLMLPHNAPFPM